MANRCYNILTITGNHESLLSLLDYVKSNEGVLDFNRIIPYQIERDQSAAGAAEQIEIESDWRVEHWGSKWNATDPSLKWENDEKVIFEFDTAWAPSIPITIALSKKYPDLFFTHHYDVSRMETRGTATIITGEIVNLIKWEHEDYPDIDENA